MYRLVPVSSKEDIFPEYRDTPVGHLLEYHNLNQNYETYTQAQLLIGMCMDNRIMLRIPDNFAYVLRAGGANFQRIEFKVSYAVAVGGIRTICLIAHDQCGMVNLRARRDVFVNGLVENGGWERQEAERHFALSSALFEIHDPVEFVLSEAQRLRERYPRVTVAPLFYQVGEGLLHQILEGQGC